MLPTALQTVIKFVYEMLSLATYKFNRQRTFTAAKVISEISFRRQMPVTIDRNCTLWFRHCKWGTEHALGRHVICRRPDAISHECIRHAGHNRRGYRSRSRTWMRQNTRTQQSQRYPASSDPAMRKVGLRYLIVVMLRSKSRSLHAFACTRFCTSLGSMKKTVEQLRTVSHCARHLANYMYRVQQKVSPKVVCNCLSNRFEF